MNHEADVLKDRGEATARPDQTLARALTAGRKLELRANSIGRI